MQEIVLAGPGKNALGSELMTRTLAAIRGAEGAPLLLRGEGDAFSAGLNLKEVVGLDRPGMEAFLGLLEELCATLFDYPAPTLALVNGHAIAGGCVLALCCDRRVGVRSARTRIGLNEVALGLRFPPRILRMVDHQLRSGARDQVLLGAGLHAPADALRLGLLDELADDPAAGEARARELLTAWGTHPPAAYAACKASLRAGVSAARPAEEERFREEVVPTWVAEELKARLRAALGG